MSEGHAYICLAGPTASGKTATALAIAEALRATRSIEIISVDSALVYHGMDIGTAKPTPAELAAVPHHLIDIIEPDESYSAARFVSDATQLIADIHARGRLPLLVGGTMLYFKALFDGLSPMPAADASVRAEIDRRAAIEGWPAMHAELARIDPATAQRLKPLDAQRIQRALEVWHISGRTMSSFHQDSERKGLRPPLISLEPADRSWLHERIAQRFELMLRAGFIDEVRRLRARGDLDVDMPSMRSVGYRQAWEALERDDFSEWPGNGIAATRQLAKRQLTWLRSMAWRDVVPCDSPDARQRAIAVATAHAGNIA